MSQIHFPTSYVCAFLRHTLSGFKMKFGKFTIDVKPGEEARRVCILLPYMQTPNPKQYIMRKQINKQLTLFRYKWWPLKRPFGF